MAKQEIFEVLQEMGGTATVGEIFTHQSNKGKDITVMTIWQDLGKLMNEKRVRLIRRRKGGKKTSVFTITGKSGPRNVVVLNGDGTIERIA